MVDKEEELEIALVTDMANIHLEESIVELYKTTES